MDFYGQIGAVKPIIESLLVYTCDIRRRPIAEHGKPATNKEPELIETVPCWLQVKSSRTPEGNSVIEETTIFLPLETNIQLNDELTVNQKGHMTKYTLASKPRIYPTHIELSVGGTFHG